MFNWSVSRVLKIAIDTLRYVQDDISNLVSKMGGCISRLYGTESPENVFRVINLDEAGHGTYPGRLEVTENALILHHSKGRRDGKCTVWALKYLRRYGYKEDLFTFESGRRSETGEGVYAFRCHRAEELFLAIQEKIQTQSNIVESVSPALRTGEGRFPLLPTSVTTVPAPPPPPTRAPTSTTAPTAAEEEERETEETRNDEPPPHAQGNYVNVPVNGCALPLRESPSDEVEENDLVPVYVTRTG
ncbi:unnamed protein product [Cyprideis torosa]|uniref:Uncharacterized protein n=1 Tax=Cyprideis torosa TaxID=163714 RepID=A0A7R8WRF0_9CRUS|nr:unnamed protein product [Cyprideis torosa]CAG0907445.1 unnamed protein product [Cyprideis torosa]